MSSSALDKPCDICGDVGFWEAIVTCEQCKVAREHVYCTRYNSLIIPDIWFCEECVSSNHLVSPQLNSKGTVPDASKSNPIRSVKPESKESLLGEEEPTHAPIHVRKDVSSKERAKQMPENEQSLLGEGEPTHPIHAKKDAHSKAGARQGTRKALCTSSLAAKPPRPSRRSGDNFHYDAKLKSSGVQERPLSYNLLHYEKYPSNRPNLEATWNGSFEILSMVPPGEIYSGFRAHLPHKVDRKVYKFAKQMPEVLQFKLLPRSDIWEEIFQNDFAYGYDISLYFFPGNLKRSIQQYVSLWAFIEMQDMVMSCCMKGVELLIFTSKGLHYAEELNWESFFWGVFRAVKDNNVAAPSDELFKAHVQTSAVKDNHVAATPSSDELIEVHVQTSAGKGNHVAATPSSDGLFEVHEQTSNAGMTVGHHYSEVKNIRPNDLDVPPGFSRKTAHRAAHELILEKSSSELIEVPIYQLPIAVGWSVMKAEWSAAVGDDDKIANGGMPFMFSSDGIASGHQLASDKASQ